jgi:hypothetical protein
MDLLFSISPTQCATKVIDELLIAFGPDQLQQREQMIRLIRQLVRDQYEHCAQIAEHWVPEHDLYEQRDGMEVGDAIAEAIRKLADERIGSVVELADTQVLGACAARRVGSTPSAPTI